MRLAFIVPGGLGRLSGGYIYDRSLVAGLRGIGVEVDEVALPWPPFPRVLLENLRPLPWPRAPASYDAVIEDELAHPALLTHNLALRARRVPIVALVHNLACEQPSTRARAWPRALVGNGKRVGFARYARARLERRFLRGVDGVVAVCESTARDVRAVMGTEARAAKGAPERARGALAVVRAGRDHVPAAAVAGIDDAFIERRAREGGPLRVLFVGACAPHKGVDRLLAAVARVPEAALDVVGPLDRASPFGARLASEAARPELSGRVRFHGVLGGDALWDAYRRAQVLALPSDREAFPLAVLEAMGFGLVCLVTTAGGANELVTSPTDGLLLDPHAPQAWPDAVASLARDRELLARIGRAARGRYESLGTWRDAAQAVTRFLQKLVRRVG